MRHLISPLDFTVEETYEVLDFADRIAANPKAYAHAADGRQLATLFYEPSTRTRLSFESAMLWHIFPEEQERRKIMLDTLFMIPLQTRYLKVLY